MIEVLNEAFAALCAGDRACARILSEKALALDPNRADALNMLGLLAQQAGDIQARALIEESTLIRSDVARAYYNLAIVCTLQDDVVRAIFAYEQSVIIAPDFAEAHSNLGNLYRQTGRGEDALHAYAAAIRAKPNFAAVYCNLATVLIDIERYDEAIQALHEALRLSPDIPEAHANLGQAYRRSGRYCRAIAATQRALELRPDYPEAYLNLALAACEIDASDIALDANRRALELDTTSPEVHCNRARVFYMTGRYAEAIAASEAAIALRPDYSEAHVNLAVSLLVCGDFARGWDEYIWMWRVPSRRAAYPYLDCSTLWNGEPFAGRELLITRDQGFGDAIQMARYLPAVKELGGRVILEAAPALAPLFEALPGVDELRIVRDVATLRPEFDLHVPILGLARAFRTGLTSIPAPIPYLRASDERVVRWSSRLKRQAHLRIGIVWAGYPSHANDRHRSARLEEFSELGAIEGIAWFGLQMGREQERRASGSLMLDPLGPEITDFADTAAILAHLDLVIAVDTAVVHLAGALGKPVWTLLPFAPDWRWMTERNDSPWYPTMRLFRQPRAGDWASVVAEVARDIRTLASRDR